MPKKETKTAKKKRFVSSTIIRKNALKDLTNCCTTKNHPSKSVLLNNNNNILENDKHDEINEDLNGLILLHSHLSTLIHQVDELVSKVLKAPNKIGRNEIESLTQVLLDMQSSLKPWPLRFEKALSSHSNGSEDHLIQSVVSENVDAGEDTTDVVQSPEESKIDSIISPSPLVAWRGESKVDGGGRQLFLLTPLPRSKALSSNRRGYLKSAFEKFKSDNGFQSLLGLSNNPKDDVVEGGEIKSTPDEVSDFTESTRESTVESEVASPPTFLKKDCSVLVFTPCMKMSPPKSCVLLEPISELNDKRSYGVQKSTPFPVGLQSLSESESSEFSSGGTSEDLSLKYPELFGIQPIHKLGNGKKGLDSSPDWFMSPPQSCVLMEPSDEKLLTDAIKNFKLSRTAGELNQSKIVPSEKRDDGKSIFTRLGFGNRYATVESTPMFKEPESSYRAGNTVKKGENTLKKELWTKFEEASSNDVRFDASVRQASHNDFLDRLDEVSVDKTKSGN